MDNAMGSALGSFALIPPYFRHFVEANPGSVVGIETEVDDNSVETFKYLFYSIDACRKGYKFMRNVVVIDGTHLSSHYSGCLLAASAQDENFQIFPLGFGIVNSENDDAWEWFLRKLTKIPDEPELVFVSDRHSSIYAAIRKVYPMASHAACLVHVQRNVQTIFKTPGLPHLLSLAARSYRITDFDRYFGK